MKTILKIQLVLLLLTSFAFAGQSNQFPTNPNLTETPGKLCTNSKLVDIQKISLIVKEVLIHI